MAFNFHVDPGVRVEDQLYREMLKPGRAEKLHGAVKHVQCHAEGSFTVTFSDGTVKKNVHGTRVWNLINQDRRDEPGRRAKWDAEHKKPASQHQQKVPLPSGADERMAATAAASPAPLDADAAHRRFARW